MADRPGPSSGHTENLLTRQFRRRTIVFVRRRNRFRSRRFSEHYLPENMKLPNLLYPQTRKITFSLLYCSYLRKPAGKFPINTVVTFTATCSAAAVRKLRCRTKLLFADCINVRQNRASVTGNSRKIQTHRRISNFEIIFILYTDPQSSCYPTLFVKRCRPLFKRCVTHRCVSY